MRKKISTIEEKEYDWKFYIAWKINKRIYLVLTKEQYTNPNFEGDMCSLVMFDFEELDNKLPPVGWLRIGTRIAVRLYDKSEISSTSFGIEFPSKVELDEYKKYLRQSTKRPYII